MKNKRHYKVIFILCCLLFLTTQSVYGIHGQVGDSPKQLLEELDIYISSFVNSDWIDTYRVSLTLADIINLLELNTNPKIQRFGISRQIYLFEIVDQYNGLVVKGEQLSQDDVKILVLLAKDYQEELNILGYDIQDLDLAMVDSTPHNSPRGDIEPWKDNSLVLQTSNIGRPSITGTVQYDDGYYTIGQLSKKLLVPYSEHQDEETPQLAINNLIPFWPDLHLGAGFLLTQTEDDINSGYAGLAGEYLIKDDVVLEGQYLHDLSQPLKTGILQLGARVKLGNVELDGLFHAQENMNKNLTTSLGLTYGMPNSFSVRAGAGYQVDSDLKTIGELGNPVTTSLDVDIPISQGRIIIGFLQEWNQEKDVADSDEEFSDTLTASLGLSYALDNSSFIQLDYSLINFSSIDTRAKFSIRF